MKCQVYIIGNVLDNIFILVNIDIKTIDDFQSCEHCYEESN